MPDQSRHAISIRRQTGLGHHLNCRGATLVKMLLLAGPDALIRCPPGSFFSFHSAVMKRHR